MNKFTRNMSVSYKHGARQKKPAVQKKCTLCDPTYTNTESTGRELEMGVTSVGTE